MALSLFPSERSLAGRMQFSAPSVRCTPGSSLSRRHPKNKMNRAYVVGTCVLLLASALQLASAADAKDYGDSRHLPRSSWKDDLPPGALKDVLAVSQLH